MVRGFASPYVLRVVTLMGISIMLVVSLNLSNGFTGVFSLGHVGFMAIGAYVSSILTLAVETKAQNLPDLPSWLAHVQTGFFPAMLIAGLAAALIAFLIGIPLMRLSGHYVSVATLGFLVIVRVVLVNWTQFTRGARTFSGGAAPYHALLGLRMGGGDDLSCLAHCAFPLRARHDRSP